MISDLVSLKTTLNTSCYNNTNQIFKTKTQRTIDIATAVVRINKIITTPIMLEMHPSSGDFNLNVVQAHRNVFIAQKLIE